MCFALFVKKQGLSPCGESGLKLTAEQLPAYLAASLPMRGEWIEIPSPPALWWNSPPRLSPCGESGLKLLREPGLPGQRLSLPMRGEWIEMITAASRSGAAPCLSPLGESGLKSFSSRILPTRACLSPLGESGLKSVVRQHDRQTLAVSPRSGRVD